MYALKLFLQALGCRFLVRSFLENNFNMPGKENSNITLK
jgi:hypothetical protein